MFSTSRDFLRINLHSSLRIRLQALALLTIQELRKKSKTLGSKLFIIGDAEQQKKIKLLKIPTSENPADILTKSSADARFEKHPKNSGFVKPLKEGVEG